ncbi:MAG TPA: pilus assembly protein TadG-related protein [Acidimicrobiia bacterium]
MRRWVRLRQGEDGAAVVMVALSLTLLLLFVAVAIDAAGLGYNERRQDQSAADVAALAAVQFTSTDFPTDPACTGYSGLTRSRCNGAAEAMKVANATLEDSSLADWSDPSMCPGKPSGFAASPLTPCVAFNANNQRAWVRIPLIEKATSIARAVGFESITTSATAMAGTSLDFPGSVLPFLVPGNASAADYNCLKTGSNPSFGPCDGSTTGNFGAMDFYLYGNEDLLYIERCTGDTNGRFSANVARGIDHPLGIYLDGVTPGKIDRDHCPNFGALPNMVYAETGNIDIEPGFLYGGTAYSAVPYPGRIQQEPNGYLVRGPQGATLAARVDNTPIWDYLRSDLGGTPCDPAVVDTPSEMLTCITWAKGTSRVILRDDIVEARRFGWTPSVWESDFGSGSSTPYHIKGYLPVYLDTTLFGCSASRCDIMHTPGVPDMGACPSSPPVFQITCGTPGSGTKDLLAIAAYILDTSIVPDVAKEPPPGSDNQRSFNLID